MECRWPSWPSAADRDGYKDLVVINRTTGVVTFVSATLHSRFKDIEALAFAPGTPIVPVAMQAGAHRRDGQGAWLEWEASEGGHDFVVQRGDCAFFRPADEIDPEYGRWLRRAARAGVEILPYVATVSRKGIILGRRLEARL